MRATARTHPLGKAGGASGTAIGSGKISEFGTSGATVSPVAVIHAGGALTLFVQGVHGWSQMSQAAPDPPAFLTIRQAAGELQASERTVRRWVRDGWIRAVRLGGAVRIA